MRIRDLVRNSIRRTATRYAITEDFDPEFEEIARGNPLLDVTSLAQHSTYAATRYVVESGIPGDFVECGVAKGTQVVVMAETLLRLGVTDRRIFLYDTFAGMTAPTEFDEKAVPTLTKLDRDGTRSRWEKDARGDHNEWCYGSLDLVRKNVGATAYPFDLFTFVQGDVCKTIPNDNHKQIAYLRLDTDFYDSTVAELNHLYPLVVRHGIVTIDDYGSWQGCRRACDEYFESIDEHPLLFRTSWKERSLVRTAQGSPVRDGRALRNTAHRA